MIKIIRKHLLARSFQLISGRRFNDQNSTDASSASCSYLQSARIFRERSAFVIDRDRKNFSNNFQKQPYDCQVAKNGHRQHDGQKRYQLEFIANISLSFHLIVIIM
ncbi:UNVERIFIED_CONTAM: hypothetical protein NCL1_34611 [Trichonephila clavipes]